MDIYLDNAATTKIDDDACEAMIHMLKEDYGNPSSLHLKGIYAERKIKETLQIFQDILKVNSKELVFTSGGTESNNMALVGAALANRRQGNHIITTRIEHPSVHNPLLYLEEQGFEMSYLSVDRTGKVDLEELKSLITKETILVSIIHVNNEIGTIQPIEQIGHLIKDINEKTLFHVDAIQSFGKFRIYPQRYKIDLLSISGHKFYGPKGVGLLYIKDRVKVMPIILGGGQQKGRRSGTENVPAIYAMGVAAKKVYDNLDETVARMYELRAFFVDKLQEIDNVLINGSTTEQAPHIISASFLNVRAEVLLHSLEEKGIFVSSGSACSSNHPALSGTLKAIGLDKKYLDATIRFSMSRDTTIADIEYCMDCLKELVVNLRRFTPGGRR